MKIAITGAQGFIGSALFEKLTHAGHEVSRWVRNPKNTEDKMFVMPNVISSTLFESKPDWIIHAAYVTQFKTAKETWEANIQGSMRLFELAEKQGVKILFLSSLSAHPDARSIYGQSKFQLESALDLSQHLVVKPGVVIGPGGLFLRMIRLLARLRFAILFWGGNQPLYSVALDELTTSCLRLIEQNATGCYHVMEPTVHTMRYFYTALMKALNIKPLMIPLPGDMSLFFVQQLEKIGMHFPISSENLLGLKQARLFKSDLDKIGLCPMTLEQAVTDTFLKLSNLDNQYIKG
jgi:NADH dehydrogenase